MKILNENGPGVPVKMWTDDVESQAMDQQSSDLVEVVAHLKQFICVKG